MDIAQMLLKRIDVKGLLIEDFLVGYLFVELEKKALETTNTLDDSLLLMLKPMLQKAADEFVDSKLAEVAK